MEEADDGEDNTGPEGHLSPDQATEVKGSPPAPGGDVQAYIGARLRQAFDDVAKQPVPDRFLQLMAELDRS